LAPSYAKTVEAACQQAGIEYLILKEYLSRDALAALRVAADITIFMPESDAMSAAALETIYAGNVLAAGAWLPYGLYRRLGLPFVEVEDYGQLARAVPALLDRPRISEPELVRLQQQIERNFCADGTVPAWIELYRSLAR
jgi:ABC-type proline/glycine betaine transport system substrate-binding protein